jgi:hypothetical protein
LITPPALAVQVLVTAVVLRTMVLSVTIDMGEPRRRQTTDPLILPFIAAGTDILLKALEQALAATVRAPYPDANVV